MIFNPTMAHCTLLNNFIQNHVFIDDDEEDQDDHSKIKGLLFTFSFFFFVKSFFAKIFSVKMIQRFHGKT